MPIACREMRLLARSPAMFRGRLYTGIVTLVSGTAFGIAYSRFNLGALPFLGMVSYMLSLMCMFTGAQTTADAIAKEKREGTLGLLLLAGLKPWQIAGEKLFSHLLIAAQRVLILYPLLTLLMIVGGVRPAEVLGTTAALLNTLFVTGCIGLYESTLGLDQKRTAGRATVMVLIFWWGLALLSQFNLQLGGPPWFSRVLLLCSLNSSLVPASFGMRMAASSTPWLNLLCTHAIGWLFLVLAAWRIRSGWQDQPDKKRFAPREWWRRLSYGNAAARFKLRANLLEVNPFLWLAARDRWRAAGVWLVTFLMLGLGVFVYVSSGYEPSPLVALCIAVTVIHRFMVTGTGAAQLLAEQEQGTLEMLLSTPMNARDVLQGQFKAAVRQWRGPATLVLTLHGALWLMFYVVHPSLPRGAVIALAISGVSYLFDSYTGIWLAMWGAVISPDSKKASGAALVRLLGTPFMVVSFASIALALSNTFLNFQFTPAPVYVVVAIALLSIGNNVYWLRRVHVELPGLLRTYAFRRYAPAEETGFFARLGRFLGRINAQRSSAKLSLQSPISGP